MPGFYNISRGGTLYYQKQLNFWPMDKTSTSDFCLSENLIKKALKEEHYPSPSKISLEFIRNFARNLRVQANIDSTANELVLN